MTLQMAEHALVLGLSILDTWDRTQGGPPDLRLLIIEPSQLDTTSLAKLRDAGWGLCHVEMPDYMKTGTIPQYTLSYSKLFVWNMTMYSSLLWLDSDCLVVDSLHRVLARANRSTEHHFIEFSDAVYMEYWHPH